MRRWEYLRAEHDASEIATELDALGREGWEAFAASERRESSYSPDADDRTVVSVMLRREVTS